jgi:DnaJ homolog subfamily A member 2
MLFSTGRVTGLRSVGPGLVTQVTQPCGSCSGAGKVYKDKDKCKRCKGARVVETRKLLELYIPRGSREGDKIVLQGEADQEPDVEPGDIVFVLKETPHDIFRRAGSDLAAEITITLAEALTGFHRVVLTHLDSRGLSLHVHQPAGKILRPEQVLKVPGEGMPIKRSDARGDLYLILKIEFPEDGWIADEAAVRRIRDVLPGPGPPVEHGEEVDEVEFEEDADLDDFGSGATNSRGGVEWEDDDDDEDGMEGGPQCTQQ